MAARKLIHRAFLVYGTLFAAFLGIAVGAIAWDLTRFLNRPLPVTEPKLLQVAPGSTFTSLSRQWVNEGVIRWPHHARYLQLYARLSRKDVRLQVGEYNVLPGMTGRGLVDGLISGRVYQHRLTVIEGWTFAQMMRAIAGEKRLKRVLTDYSAATVMQALGRPGEHPEGRFYPDTYNFTSSMSDVEFLRRAYDNMSRILEQEWAGRAGDVPLNSPYEALILASIVEKETGKEHERGQIAGVFARRLKLGMLLQTDPTVIYGMGSAYAGNIRREDLLRDTPYNTYTRAGLPPTPICLPGRAAIHAAVQPAPGEAIYFVSRGDGTHEFSATIEQHNNAVRKYQLKRP